MRNQRVGNCHGSIQSTLWRLVCAGWMGLGIGMVGVDLHVVRHLLSSPGDGRGRSVPRRVRHGVKDLAWWSAGETHVSPTRFSRFHPVSISSPHRSSTSPFFFLLSFLHRSSRSIGGQLLLQLHRRWQLRQARLPPGDCSPNLWRPLCCLLIDHWGRGGGERGPWGSGVLDGRRRWQGGCSRVCPRGSHGYSGGRQRGPHGALCEGHRRSLGGSLPGVRGDLLQWGSRRWSSYPQTSSQPWGKLDPKVSEYILFSTFCSRRVKMLCLYFYRDTVFCLIMHMSARYILLNSLELFMEGTICLILWLLSSLLWDLAICLI